MTDRVNRPIPQSGPVAFGFLCLAGAGVAVARLLTVHVGSEAWQTLVVALACLPLGLLVIVGGWLWIQREVAFTSESILVRRWIEVLLGLPGRRLPLDGRTTAAITLENVRSLRLSRDGGLVVRLTLGYWPPQQIGALVDSLRAHRVQLDQYWQGDKPPGVP